MSVQVLRSLADRLDNIPLEEEVQQLPKVAILPAPAEEPDIGKLSAEAVQAQYEHAARSVEHMGEEIQDRIRKLNAALGECHGDMGLLAEAAKAIRDKGHLVAAQIQEAANVSKTIRETCAAIGSKLG